MPFEPRIHNNEDPGESGGLSGMHVGQPEEPVWDDAEALELPDDLAMLADQLRDDAVYLSEKHPADATSEERESAWKEFVESKSTTPHFEFPWRAVSAAAALLAMFAVGGWAIYFNQPSGTTESTFIAGESTMVPIVGLESTAANFEELNRANQSEVDELPGGQPRLIPATFLRDVSGPELDGMLDLLEEDESGLSI